MNEQISTAAEIDALCDMFRLDQNPGAQIVILDADGRAWVITGPADDPTYWLCTEDEAPGYWASEVSLPAKVLSPDAEPAPVIDAASTANFILNRLDSVASWVIEWMPPEDNALHHNAVEHLVRAHQEVIRLTREMVPKYRPEPMSEDIAIYVPLGEFSDGEASEARQLLRRLCARAAALRVGG